MGNAAPVPRLTFGQFRLRWLRRCKWRVMTRNWVECRNSNVMPFRCTALRRCNCPQNAGGDIRKKSVKMLTVLSLTTLSTEHRARWHIHEGFLHYGKFERTTISSLSIAKALVADVNAATKICEVISRHLPFDIAMLKTLRLVTVRKIFWII